MQVYKDQDSRKTCSMHPTHKFISVSLTVLGLLFVMLLSVTLFIHPSQAQTTSAPEQTDSSIEVGDDAPTDEEIRTRISKLLFQIDSYSEVRVAVSEGVVRLSGTVVDNVARDELTNLVNRVRGVVAIENKTDVSASIEERLAPAADRILERTRNLLANAPIFFVAVASFIVVAAGGWLLTTRLGIWTWIAPNNFIGDVYRAVARIAFILLGVVLALDILNATALIGAVLGAAGVVGLALGFAVRDTVENFIASILLSLRQPFRPNDFVDIQGDMGTVARLTSRATILISPEGNHIRIPNATVYKGRIVNFSRDPQRRFDFNLGVDADADQAGALAVAVNALNDLPFVLRDPEVGAWVHEVGDSNVVLTFTGWVDQTSVNFVKARGEAIRTAKSALEAAGYGLPEPIYRVRLDGVGNIAASVLGSAASADQNDGVLRRTTKPEPTVEAALPQAADPTRKENATTDAAERERSTADEEEGNLLDHARQGE